MKNIYASLLLLIPLNVWNMEEDCSPLQKQYASTVAMFLKQHAPRSSIQSKVEDCLMIPRMHHRKFSRDLHAHLAIPNLTHDEVVTAMFQTNFWYFDAQELEEIFKYR